MRVIVVLWCFYTLTIVVCRGSPEVGGSARAYNPLAVPQPSAGAVLDEQISHEDHARNDGCLPTGDLERRPHDLERLALDLELLPRHSKLVENRQDAKAPRRQEPPQLGALTHWTALSVRSIHGNQKSASGSQISGWWKSPLFSSRKRSERPELTLESLELRVAAIEAYLGLDEASLSANGPRDSAGVVLPGVSLAGGEFGKLGSPMYKGYIYPPDDRFDYYASKGFRLVRLPFRIERLQPEAFGDLTAEELEQIDRCVDAARDADMVIVLDAHNYGRRNQNTIDKADLANFWCRIADRYRGDEHVALGLMSNPMAYKPEAWREVVDHTIKSLRKMGFMHRVMVPVGGWNSAHEWISRGNAAAFDGFSDENFLFEVHQFLDRDGRGRQPQEYAKGAGGTRLEVFTRWARRQGYRAFLGGFGFALPAGEAESRGKMGI